MGFLSYKHSKWLKVEDSRGFLFKPVAPYILDINRDLPSRVSDIFKFQNFGENFGQFSRDFSPLNPSSVCSNSNQISTFVLKVWKSKIQVYEHWYQTNRFLCLDCRKLVNHEQTFWSLN